MKKFKLVFTGLFCCMILLGTSYSMEDNTTFSEESELIQHDLHQEIAIHIEQAAQLEAATLGDFSCFGICQTVFEYCASNCSGNSACESGCLVAKTICEIGCLIIS